MRILPPRWHEAYLGRPWAAVPQPPQSYTCGELVRAVHRDFFGIDSPPIPVADAGDLKACVKAMRPERYGLQPLAPGRSPREMDVLFFVKARLRDHCGIAVRTANGLWVLHCQQQAGVILSPLVELRAHFYRVLWYRHPGLDAAAARRAKEAARG